MRDLRIISMLLPAHQKDKKERRHYTAEDGGGGIYLSTRNPPAKGASHKELHIEKIKQTLNAHNLNPTPHHPPRAQSSPNSPSKALNPSTLTLTLTISSSCSPTVLSPSTKPPTTNLACPISRLITAI